jgi:putative ABC transport system substrate-binding protein
LKSKRLLTPQKKVTKRKENWLFVRGQNFSVCFLLFLFCTFPILGNTDSSTVYMVLWRGKTDAEQGFTDYFKTRKLPVRFIVKDCSSNAAKIPEIIWEINRRKPNLVYAFGTTVAVALAGTLSKASPLGDIPVVFQVVADPVGAKLVKDLKSSGRNITGASHIVPIDAQIQSIKSMLDFKRIAIVYNTSEKNSVLMMETLKKQSAKYGYQVFPMPATTDKALKENELQKSIHLAIKEKKPDVVYLPSDSYIISHASTIINTIHSMGVPTFSAAEEPIRKNGALFGIVCRYYNMGQFVGFKAEQILFQGKRPRDIPVETLKRFSFIVNMSASKMLGIYPPVSVLRFAEIVTDSASSTTKQSTPK